MSSSHPISSQSSRSSTGVLIGDISSDDDHDDESLSIDARNKQQRSAEHTSLLTDNNNHSSTPDIPPLATEPSTIPNALTILIVFSFCNLLTYFDRGCIGVCLESISDPRVFNLNNFEGGVLAGCYMLGYIGASPVFALAVRKYDPFKVMSCGLLIWSIAALGCALAFGFVSLLIARGVSGIGEAAFLCIAPPFIDKVAPAAKKSQWMGVFYCAIPIGYAMGFVVAGQWLNVTIVHIYYQWRFIFLLEFILMLPFVFWCYMTPTPPHNFADPSPLFLASQGQHVSTRHEDHETVGHVAQNQQVSPNHAPQQAESDGTNWQQYKYAVFEVLSNKVYITIVLGYAAQTFVLGSVAYFGVKYLVNQLKFSVGAAGTYFGLFTVVMGICGTLFGGWLCDYLRGDKNKAHATAVAMKLAFMLSTIAFPLCLCAFIKAIPEYFFTFFVIAEFILFSTASPINSAVIWSVPFRLSPLACSLSIMFIHVLGDAISPVIIGAILDWTKNWQITMIGNTCWLVWSCIFWFFAWRFAEAKAARIDEDLLTNGPLHVLDPNLPVEESRDLESPDFQPSDAVHHAWDEADIEKSHNGEVIHVVAHRHGAHQPNESATDSNNVIVHLDNDGKDKSQ